MYNNYGGFSSGVSVGVLVAIILFTIIAIAGGIVLQIVFLSKKNEGRFTGFLGWLYDFLSFKTWMIEVIIKVLYLIETLSAIFFGLIMLFVNFGIGLLMIIFGPIIIRIVYELSMLFIMLCFNVSSINNKLGKANAAVKAAPAQAVPVQETPVAPVRVCSNCGAKLSDDSVFCQECGTKNA